MNNFIEKILILILVFTTITFAVPLNYDQEACPIGFGRCIDGRAPTENDALSRRFPKIKLPKLGPILKNPILKEPTIKGPGSSPVWKGLNSFRGQTKTRGTGKNKQYLEWDFTHNDIEVYDNKGKHLGSMDPSSGNMVKPPYFSSTFSII
uniref:Colicin E3-like ribonuclease domain-containing protein n=1 Tax=Rhizophagus irregularis (strain DAOM 181602 / DAOM 197198 / MUCL 43194) TaxID=747089 RepID=U9SR73_RHIID